MKKAGFVVGGWFAIGLGVAGLALPFPGMMLILLGLVILSSHYVWAQRALDWFRNKFPRTTSFADLHWANLRGRFTDFTSR
jgi:Putative transmembrane protein (PGPGW)